MIIELDTEAQTIKVRGVVNIGELIKYLHKILPDWEYENWCLTDAGESNPFPTQWLTGTSIQFQVTTGEYQWYFPGVPNAVITGGMINNPTTDEVITMLNSGYRGKATIIVDNI